MGGQQLRGSVMGSHSGDEGSDLSDECRLLSDISLMVEASP